MHTNRRSLAGLMFVCASLAASPAAAQDSTRTDSSSLKRLLYPNVSYGSEGYFSPVTVLFNKGFDHFQAKNASRDFWGFRFRNAIENGALDALAHPAERIEEFPGWKKWLRTEVFPLTYTSRDGRWAVNYLEHLIAGGLTYRSLGEWYDVRGIPAPRLWAASTTFAAGILNEAAENAASPHGSSSSVADLYVFDLGGILLMNWDALPRFFKGTLEAADWENLATFTFPNGDLQNTGQYYIYKIPLPGTTTRLFVRSGMGIQAGLSRHIDAEHSLTLALGMDTKVRDVDPVTLDETIKMRFGAGVYFDRNNSLLASVTAGPTSNSVAVNVYPGVIGGITRDAGLWAAYTRAGQITGGVVFRRALGLGMGYGK